MTKSRIIWAVVAAAAMGSMAPGALADDPPDLFPDQLDDFIWSGGGDGTTWGSAPNWTPPSGFTGEFPDDPGRLDNDGNDNNDADLIDLEPVEGANFSVPRASDLTVNIATADVTVAAVKMGGTTSSVTTDITATAPFRLVFENAELNDTSDDGMPNADPPVDPVVNWSYNQGNALIWSTGNASNAAKVNRISADILLNDNVDVEGDRDLHIYGNIYEGVADRNTGDAIIETLPSSINNLLANGKTLYIHGNINLIENDGNPQVADVQERTFGINRSRGVVLPPDPLPDPEPEDVPRWGTVDIIGNITGTGYLELGPDDGGAANLTPLSTIILRNNNSGFLGRTLIGRANVVLGHDNALGAGGTLANDNVIVTKNPNQGFGFNFIAGGGNRTIAVPVNISQWATVKAASDVAGLEEFGDHSITFTGEVVQMNTRGWANLLPEGQTLTLSGPQYPNKKSENPPSAMGRWYTVDGSGKTMITGGIYDQYNDNPSGTTNFTGNFRKRGNGTVVIDWSISGTGTIPNPSYNDAIPEHPVTNPSTIPDRATDYLGFTSVEGGNLHFATNEDLPGIVGGAQAAGFVSINGAVGIDSGALTNTDFQNQFNNSASPTLDSGTPTSSPFFRSFGDGALLNNYDHGGLMLATSEYGSNLNFSTGNMLKLANMSLAADEDDSSFTGTITPATFSLTTSGVPVNASTFMLGGGNGKLTLPNNNQLTGANKLLVTNGGEVAIVGTHGFTGGTRVSGEYVTSIEQLAIGDQSGLEGETASESFDGISVYRGSKLTVTNLANGLSNSSVGSSSNVADNLLIQGSTLKYVGGAQSTDRLFTIGTHGATIDASGSGALQFSNAGAVGVDNAETRAGALSTGIASGANNEIFGIPTSTAGTLVGGYVVNQQVLFSTEDLVPGMRVNEIRNAGDVAEPTTYLQDDDSPLVITSVESPHVVRVGETDTEADFLDDSQDEDPPNVWSGHNASGLKVRLIQFGPAPARTLTLTGESALSNTITSTIGNAAASTLANTPEETAAGFGTVGVRKQGVGKWVLTGNNTYSGATTVQEGTLLVNGAQTGGGAYNVTGGGQELAVDAILGGTGSITGAVTASGTTFHKGTIAPGASVGTLSVTGNVTMGEYSNLLIELSGATADKLAITGDLDLSALLNSVTVTGAGTGGNWLIATYTGALTGLFETVTSGYSLNYATAGQIRLLAAPGGLAGDYNDDGYVDARDYTVWRNNLGDANETDLNGNGDGGGVTASDYTWWKQHYGDGVQIPGGGGVANVPEPASFVLVGIALAGIGVLRRRRL